MRIKLIISSLIICLTGIINLAFASNADQVLTQLTTPRDHSVMTVVGNKQGNVTLIEFTDFNCPYCKVMTPIVKKLINNDKNLRVVIIEYPVIASTSKIAAMAAMSAESQGKFFNYHNALMEHKGHVSKTDIFAIAKQQGLNIAKLETTMNSASIKKEVEHNLDLGFQLGIPGTPTLIVAKTLLKPTDNLKNSPQAILSFGFIKYEDLQHAITQVRQAEMKKS